MYIQHFVLKERYHPWQIENYKISFSYIPKLNCKWIEEEEEDDDEKVLHYSSKLFSFLLGAGKGKLFLFNMTLCMFTKLAKTL